MQDVIMVLKDHMNIKDYHPILYTCKYFRNTTDIFINHYIDANATFYDFMQLDDLPILTTVHDKYPSAIYYRDCRINLFEQVQHIPTRWVRKRYMLSKKYISNTVIKWLLLNVYVTNIALIHDVTQYGHGEFIIKLSQILIQIDAILLYSIEYMQNDVFDHNYIRFITTVFDIKICINKAACSDNIHALKVIIKNFSADFDQVQVHYIRSAEAAMLLFPYMKRNIFDAIVRGRNIQAIKYAINNRRIYCNITRNVWRDIIYFHDLEILDYLYNNTRIVKKISIQCKLSWDKQYIEWILNHTNITIYEYILRGTDYIDNKSHVDDIISWLLSKDIPVYDNINVLAEAHNYEWLKNNHDVIDDVLISRCIYFGNLELLKYIHDVKPALIECYSSTDILTTKYNVRVVDYMNGINNNISWKFCTSHKINDINVIRKLYDNHDEYVKNYDHILDTAIFNEQNLIIQFLANHPLL